MREYTMECRVRVCCPDELGEDDRQLVEAARRATRASYAPFSKFRVGAAARLAGGVVVTGCNQENAAFPSGLCAERAALFAAGSLWPDEPVVALAVAARKGRRFLSAPVSPCGACRQVMCGVEERHGRPMRVLLYGAGGVHVVDSAAALLPLAFKAGDMG